jgi:hypothetical protein
VLAVTAGKVTRAAQRTRRTSREMLFTRLGHTPNPAVGLVPRSNALPEYTIGFGSLPALVHH